MVVIVQLDSFTDFPSAMNNQIKFVYFDLGNILVRFDPEIALKNLCEVFGVNRAQAREVVYESGAQSRFELGHFNGEEFAAEIRRALRLTSSRMPTMRLLDALSDMFLPIEEMAEILDVVRANGYGVGLLSNTCQSHWDWICNQPYLMNQFSFDATVLSFEEHAMKPDSVIYEVAEQRAGVSAGDILFLDDKAENVQAARNRGWFAQRCLGGPEAISVLKGFEVLGTET